MGYGEEDYRGNLLFLSHCMESIHYEHDITVVNLGHLAEISSLWKFFSPHLPHTVLFERNSQCAAHTSGVEGYSFPTWGQDVYINYLKFFCTRDFSLLCRSTFSSYFCQESNFRQPLPFFFSFFCPWIAPQSLPHLQLGAISLGPDMFLRVTVFWVLKDVLYLPIL